MDTVRIEVTTNAAGEGIVIAGIAMAPFLLYAVEWVKGTFDAGVDAVLSVTNTPSGVDYTLLTLTNADNNKMYYPRHVEHDQTGADQTTRGYPVVNGDLKLAISQGGNAKTGSMLVTLIT